MDGTSKMTKNLNLRKMIVALCAVFLLNTGPLVAQEISPELIELARKYVDLTDRSQIYEVTVVQTGIDTLRTLTGQNPEVADTLTTVIGDTVKGYRERKGELMDQFARIYAQRFTLEELTVIVEFYESDIGQKLSRENFEANQQIGTVLRIFQQNLRIEFLAEVRATLRDQGIEL